MPVAGTGQTSSVDNLLTPRSTAGYNKQTDANVGIRAVAALGNDFNALLTRGALVVLVAAAAWLLAVLVAVALEARSRGRVRLAGRLGCPAGLRLWLLGLFLALFAGVAPAQAHDAGTGPGSAAVEAALEGLPLPDRATGAPRRAGVGALVEVRAGDSLWRIARRLLPDGAADSAVARSAARLYADNRPLLGPDPDLIFPGQRLLVTDSTMLSEEP